METIRETIVAKEIYTRQVSKAQHSTMTLDPFRPDEVQQPLCPEVGQMVHPQVARPASPLMSVSTGINPLVHLPDVEPRGYFRANDRAQHVSPRDYDNTKHHP